MTTRAVGVALGGLAMALLAIVEVPTALAAPIRLAPGVERQDDVLLLEGRGTPVRIPLDGAEPRTAPTEKYVGLVRRDPERTTVRIVDRGGTVVGTIETAAHRVVVLTDANVITLPEALHA